MKKFSIVSLLAYSALSLSFSLSTPHHAFAENSRVRVILVGDSTMATKSGYGDALCQRFQANVECINLARGGRSSGSFRAEGLWDKVQELLQQPASTNATTYVLIQFGHNDQPGKPGRSTDLVTEFPVNMARYVTEVKAWNGVPVLLTPLTRRSFKEGVLENNLKPWAEAIEKVALETKTILLPLNAESHAAVQAMGEAEADTLAVAPPPAKVPSTEMPTSDIAKVEPQGAAKSAFDRTHVGSKGAAFFSHMVEQELKQQVPALRTAFKMEAAQ
ncbi:rhamnogalacturonan acetylesterase [Undibacterium flavidum]|uniref:Rhamnogalacturonan acetylesterase n=1 Tax=Undibacterium flavidum TaxID=2762297 RepID=A0ABR6YH86_9BURK|nr:rhamnogalacturonan acetylesterase [Undibacterium flavidum]MBC3875809.1 rhamnogalacturonan acetylesterase [Undibacterium flavidum]